LILREIFSCPPTYRRLDNSPSGKPNYSPLTIRRLDYSGGGDGNKRGRDRHRYDVIGKTLGDVIEKDFIDGYDRIRFRIIARNKRPALPGSCGHEISLIALWVFYSFFKIDCKD